MYGLKYIIIKTCFILQHEYSKKKKSGLKYLFNHAHQKMY